MSRSYADLQWEQCFGCVLRMGFMSFAARIQLYADDLSALESTGVWNR